MRSEMRADCADELGLGNPEVESLTFPGVVDKNLEGDLVKLNSQDLALFRGCTSMLMYVSEDRPELRPAAKDVLAT